MINVCVIKPKNYIHYLAFKEIAELIYFSSKDLNINAQISFNFFDPDPSNINILIGAHLLNDNLLDSIPLNTIIFNTEQICEKIIYLIENDKERKEIGMKGLDTIKKFPQNIITISLENLNNDKYKETKKIFEFCDLNWNEEIFEFHKRDNLYIKTSSNVQLRTGIQSYDYNKYKRYYSLFEDYKKNYDWLNN
jgi:hypothetical protein